jgi:hypothetical protein
MLRTQNFFKRKKEKKESRLLKWRVLKKHVFQIKYYPIRDFKCMCGTKYRRCFGNLRVEILSETRRA